MVSTLRVGELSTQIKSFWEWTLLYSTLTFGLRLLHAFLAQIMSNSQAKSQTIKQPSRILETKNGKNFTGYRG